MNVTLRTRESLIDDLDDCNQQIIDLTLANQILSMNLAEVINTAKNRKLCMHELQKENDELKNRRD